MEAFCWHPNHCQASTLVNADKQEKLTCARRSVESGSEQRVFWKRGPFRKVHFLEILESLVFRGSRDSRDIPTVWKTKENPTIS